MSALSGHTLRNGSGAEITQYSTNDTAHKSEVPQGSSNTANSPSVDSTSQAPNRQVLTKPSEPGDDQVYDNINSDLIVAVDDAFISSHGNRYIVRSLLGHGTFGQVFKCASEATGEIVAVKVIKNQPAYFHQARVEIGVLQFLNTRADAADKHHIVRMQDFFMHRNHLCLVFELLSLNLYELIRHNKYRGLSLPLVRVFISQMLETLTVLRDSKIIHCDIKPENVLLKSYESGDIKIIDFGSACFENKTVYSYIQSRFYRSPEVVLGHSYNMAIDIWSLGCVAAELFLGLPLFPGACEYDLLSRMVDMLGPPAASLLASGKHTEKYFTTTDSLSSGSPQSGQPIYVMRTREEFESTTGKPAPIGKTYFKHSMLTDIIGAYPYKSGLSDEQIARERLNREAFTDFLLGILDMNPVTRWTPRQASKHPFITGQPFTGPFQPSPDVVPVPAPMPRPSSSLLTNALGMPSSSNGGSRSGVTAQSWTATTADPQVAQVLATSPQVHAQAHVAAMAAVAQMRLQQEQQAGVAIPYNTAGRTTSSEYDPGQYDAAHSLARIVPGLGTTPASYGRSVGGFMPSTSFGTSFATPMLSPPSRSFGPHLHAPNYNSGGDFFVGSHGVQPLLTSNIDMGPMSFQPSSVSTYQAALAAAHASLQGQAATVEQPTTQWVSMDGSTGTPNENLLADAVDEEEAAVWDPLEPTLDDDETKEDGIEDNNDFVENGLAMAAQQLHQLNFLQPEAPGGDGRLPVNNNNKPPVRFQGFEIPKKPS